MIVDDPPLSGLGDVSPPTREGRRERVHEPGEEVTRVGDTKAEEL